MKGDAPGAGAELPRLPRSRCRAGRSLLRHVKSFGAAVAEGGVPPGRRQSPSPAGCAPAAAPARWPLPGQPRRHPPGSSEARPCRAAPRSGRAPRPAAAVARPLISRCRRWGAAVAGKMASRSLRLLLLGYLGVLSCKCPRPIPGVGGTAPSGNAPVAGGTVPPKCECARKGESLGPGAPGRRGPRPPPRRRCPRSRGAGGQLRGEGKGAAGGRPVPSLAPGAKSPRQEGKKSGGVPRRGRGSAAP